MLETDSLGMTYTRRMCILKSLADDSEIQPELISTKKETPFIDVYFPHTKILIVRV